MPDPYIPIPPGMGLTVYDNDPRPPRQQTSPPIVNEVVSPARNRQIDALLDLAAPPPKTTTKLPAAQIVSPAPAASRRVTRQATSGWNVSSTSPPA